MQKTIQFVRKKVNFFFVATAVWLALLFATTTDPITQFKMQWELWRLQREEQYYTEKISDVEQERAEVLGNDALVEKYARERYLMKKDNEDLFVLVDEAGNPVEQLTDK